MIYKIIIFLSKEAYIIHFTDNFKVNCYTFVTVGHG